jgi:hypothetical protein
LVLRFKLIRAQAILGVYNGPSRVLSALNESKLLLFISVLSKDVETWKYLHIDRSLLMIDFLLVHFSELCFFTEGNASE